MKRVALVFPGQGSQRVGMAKDLLENWRRVTSDVLEEAGEAIQCNLERLMVDGPADHLTQTQFAQPAILAHSIAVLRILQHESDFQIAQRAAFVMGHSLGEYSALVAADALPFVDAIQLVHFRGQAMQRAVPEGQGAMAALMPVSSATADEICALASAQDNGRVCQVANYNSSKQTVISGTASTIAIAMEIAKREKNVRRAVRLDVSAPFHCALMAPAASELATRLAAISHKLQSPTVPVVWNVDGTALEKDPTAICASLVQQVVRPVQWSQSVDFCLEQNTTRFVELGFGSILTGLIKQHAPKADATSCGTADQLRAFLKDHAH